MQLDAHVLFLFGVCVKSSWSALTQSFSILLSAYGLANFIYVQLDLNLVDEEEIAKAGMAENVVEEVVHYTMAGCNGPECGSVVTPTCTSRVANGRTRMRPCVVQGLHICF